MDQWGNPDPNAADPVAELRAYVKRVREGLAGYPAHDCTLIERVLDALGVLASEVEGSVCDYGGKTHGVCLQCRACHGCGTRLG